MGVITIPGYEKWIAFSGGKPVLLSTILNISPRGYLLPIIGLSKAKGMANCVAPSQTTMAVISSSDRPVWFVGLDRIPMTR